ncbi:glycosyltransferase family 39 protein [Gimesia aquarii]|nr:DUF6056 family protein [Gimesia aquarii]
MAEFPLAEIWTRSAQDTHPPLFFYLLKFWGMLFGTSVFASRMLSVTSGMLTIIGTYLFVYEAYRVNDDRTSSENSVAKLSSLVAASFVALSPIHISWSLQVRMYAPGAALTAISSWLLLRALRRDSHVTRNWSFFTVSAVALSYTHHFGLFILVAQYSFATGYRLLASPIDNNLNRFSQLKPVFLSALVLILIWSPLLFRLLNQSHQVQNDFWSKPFDLDYVGRMFYQFIAPPRWSPASVAVGLGIAQATFLALILLLIGRRPTDIYLFLAVFISFLITTIYSVASRNIFISRYFLFAHLLLLIAAAVLVCRVPSKKLRVAGSIMATGLLFCFCLQNYLVRSDISEKYSGMPAAMAYLEKHRKPAENLIVCNPMLFTSAIAYTKKREGLFTYHDGKGYPYYYGSAVMRDDDYFSRERIEHCDSKWIWTLDANRWMGGSWSVPMPEGWKQVGEARFQEYYCELVFRLYEHETE